MYNKTNPHVFNTPYGPLNPVADLIDGTNEASISWQPASGAVEGYLVWIYNTTTGADDVITNSSTNLTCLLTNIADYVFWYGPDAGIEFTVQAIYAQGLSSGNFGGFSPKALPVQVAMAHGPGGKTYLLASTIGTNVTGVSGLVDQYSVSYPEVVAYAQDQQVFPTSSFDFMYDNFIPASQFTNGIAVLSDTQDIPFAGICYDNLTFQTAGNKLAGEAFTATSGSFFDNIPFIDGTVEMKDNIRFLLRAAGLAPFAYVASNTASISYPNNYVYSSLYYPYESGPYYYTSPDCFAPFQDNYFYRNFVFNSTLLDTNGNLQTGYLPFYSPAFPYEHLNYTQS